MASLHQKPQLAAKRQHQSNHPPKNKKQKDSIGIDSFDSLQFEDEITPLPTFAQHHNYFGQSPIEQKNEETFSFEVINHLSPSRKEKILLTKQAKSPKNVRQKEGSLSPVSNNRLHKIQKIVKDINNKHKEIKLNLSKIKNSTAFATARDRKGPQPGHENKLMLTLKDKRSPSPSPRYKVQGNMTQRQAERITARTKAQIARKVERAEAEMKECTFRPHLAAKKKSEHILATKVKEQERTKYQQTEQNQCNVSDNKFIVRQLSAEKKKYSTFRYQDFRNIIKCELLCLNLMI